MAATVEHIIPICKGGTHTWDNVAPAHYLCNMNKGDGMPLIEATTLV
jgi:5-methylcytosine-specific restriction endonuclease McrA